MLLTRNRHTHAELEHRLRERARMAADNRDGNGLICAGCGHPITDLEQRLAVSGAHEHRFTNPAQITFHIGCFSQAPGCATLGSSTAAHTWFAGYRWQVAVCAACGVHLGWHYRGPDSFYGLILPRLRQRRAS